MILNRIALVTLLVILCASVCEAQTTTVTGTVTDTNGNPYANGTASAAIVVASNAPIAGLVLTQTVPTNSGGTFSFSSPLALSSNQSYAFTICAKPTLLGQPTVNPTPTLVCFTSGPILVSGASQSVSSALNAIAPLLGPIGAAGTGTTTLNNLNVSGTVTVKNINNVQFCDAFPGATPDVQITNCIAALPATGGIADAWGFQGAQAPAATIVVGSSTKPVTLLLNPSSTWTCPGTSSCFDISSTASQVNGYGAILTGTNIGNHIKAANSTRARINSLRLQGSVAGGGALPYGIDVTGATDLNTDGVSWEATPTTNFIDASNPNFTMWHSGPAILQNTPGVGQFNAGLDAYQHFPGASTTAGSPGYFETGYGAPTLSAGGSAAGIALNTVGYRNGSSTNQIFAYSGAAIEYLGATGGPARGGEMDLKNSSGTDAVADATTGNMADFNQTGWLTSSAGSNLGGIGSWIKSNNAGVGNWQTGLWIQDWNTSGLTVSTGSGGFPIRIVTGGAGSAHTNVFTVDNNGNGVINVPAGSGEFIKFQTQLGTKTNWLVGAQFNVDQGFEITPSTAVGGGTFSFPSLTLSSTGVLGLANGTANRYNFTPTAPAASRTVSISDPGTNVNLGFNLRATSAAFATATTAGTCVQSTTAVTGATASMVAKASPVSTPGLGAVWSAFVSSVGNVTINECAVATSAGGSIAFNIEVTP